MYPRLTCLGHLDVGAAAPRRLLLRPPLLLFHPLPNVPMRSALWAPRPRPRLSVTGPRPVQDNFHVRWVNTPIGRRVLLFLLLLLTPLRPHYQCKIALITAESQFTQRAGQILIIIYAVGYQHVREGEPLLVGLDGPLERRFDEIHDLENHRCCSAPELQFFEAWVVHPYRDDGGRGCRHGRGGRKRMRRWWWCWWCWSSWCRSKYAAKFCAILEKRKKEERRRRKGKCVEVLLFRLRHMTAGNKILPYVDLAICPRLFSLGF